MRNQQNDANASVSNTNNGRNPPNKFIQTPTHSNQFSSVNNQLFNSSLLTSTYPVNTNMLIPTPPHIYNQIHHMNSVTSPHYIKSTTVHNNHHLHPTKHSTYTIPVTYTSTIFF